MPSYVPFYLPEKKAHRNRSTFFTKKNQQSTSTTTTVPSGLENAKSTQDYNTILLHSMVVCYMFKVRRGLLCGGQQSRTTISSGRHASFHHQTNIIIMALSVKILFGFSMMFYKRCIYFMNIMHTRIIRISC